MIERLAGGQLVRVGQLVSGQARTPSHHNTLGIEQPDLLSGNSGRDALLAQPETIRSARPMAAEPAPRKRIRWSLS